MQETLRSSDPVVFPSKEKFVEAERTGQTLPPSEVAQALWEILDSAEAANGAVLGLRELD